MDPDLQRTRTDYGRISESRHLSAQAPEWKFTGRQWTEATSNRARELTHGCGITPRVWGDSDSRISEEPVTSRESLRYATTALAQMGGITPRRRAVDDTVSQLRREKVVWHQHCHDQSRSDRKELRPLRVAGLNSAHLSYIKQRPGDRPGLAERPPWMREDEQVPGKWTFKPSDPKGDPTVFGRNSHFTDNFMLTRR
mmetsp:Transcript_43882/g.139766  ORF Transcript_43882/g.139766 Transcript_43882/m.139766 type:complete len:197 (-) Transcript_43882:208-798(-)